MKVIGLTGGIGSGKSTVSQFLAEMGAVIIDADKVGHEAFGPDAEGWCEVVNAFGEQILTTACEIDRKKLSEIVFNNPDALSRLNEIMHPRIIERVKARLAEHRRQSVEVAVIEAPLLIEAGWFALVDEVWVTIAPESAVLRRLKERSAMSEEEALSRIRSQLTPEERVKHANVVINTNCDLAELKGRVEELWQGLRAG